MGYSLLSQAHPDRLQIVRGAEPREWNRRYMTDTYQLKQGTVFSDWQDLASRPRFADAAIISTQDAMHIEPTLAFADMELPLTHPAVEGQCLLAPKVEARMLQDLQLKPTDKVLEGLEPFREKGRVIR